MDNFGFVALYGTWEALGGCKILPWGVGTTGQHVFRFSNMGQMFVYIDIWTLAQISKHVGKVFTHPVGVFYSLPEPLECNVM